MDNACRICKALTSGSECPICKSKDLTKNWKGMIIIYDPESELAKKSGHDAPGKYALQVM